MKNRAFFGQQSVFKIETPDKQNLLKNIFFSNLSNAAAADADADADADYIRADQSPSSENDYSRCSTFLFLIFHKSLLFQK
jgi:hypothetical protein